MQIKGKNRHDVMNWAEKLRIFPEFVWSSYFFFLLSSQDIGEHHVPQTFLFLYFRKLKKQRIKAQQNQK